jgi:hypothetical protein
MTASSWDSPLIFTGVPRSGTTLLGDLANRYLDVGAVNEGPFELWLDQYLGRETKLRDDVFFRRTLGNLAAHQYFTLLFRGQLSVDQIHAALAAEVEERSVEGIALAVLRISARHLERSRLGHEDPLLSKRIEVVTRVLPSCRIVHIMRDPRDASLSILSFPWGANNCLVAAMNWATIIRQMRRLGAQLGPRRYLEFRYEDLLQSPERTMSLLMEFCCGEVDQAKLAAFVEEMGANPRRRNFEKWRNKLSRRQIEAIEGCCRAEMVDLGYALTTSAPRPAAWRRRLAMLHDRIARLRNVLSRRLNWDGGAMLSMRPERPADVAAPER